MRTCWCGAEKLNSFNPDYLKCQNCGTLVSQQCLSDDQLRVVNDDTDFYGKQYWKNHQIQDLGLPDIHTRVRQDLTERNLHWLNTVLKYCLPPARALEVGCSHGSFVALLQQAGYEASGIEMSPWVVEFGRNTFDIPISIGPIEKLEIQMESLDLIVLMDVLEHLTDVVETMSHCLKLLKPNGFLLLQTPQYKEEMDYGSLMETNSPFLKMLIANEHLYLFSERSVTRLFHQLGADYIRFEPAIFGHYDMFFVVSREPLMTNSIEAIEAALTVNPNGRFVQALLDIYARESRSLGQLQADRAHLISQLQNCEADRAARLEVIESVRKQFTTQLEDCEADRAARLEVIESQGQQIKQLISQLEVNEIDRDKLYSNWLVKFGLKTGIVSTKRR